MDDHMDYRDRFRSSVEHTACPVETQSFHEYRFRTEFTRLMRLQMYTFQAHYNRYTILAESVCLQCGEIVDRTQAEEHRSTGCTGPSTSAFYPLFVPATPTTLAAFLAHNLRMAIDPRLKVFHVGDDDEYCVLDTTADERRMHADVGDSIVGAAGNTGNTGNKDANRIVVVPFIVRSFVTFHTVGTQVMPQVRVRIGREGRTSDVVCDIHLFEALERLLDVVLPK
jgi:hypothetical protein